MSRPKAYPISLDIEERRILKNIIKKTSSKNRRTRCNILLNADESKGTTQTYRQIAQTTNCALGTVIYSASKRFFSLSGLASCLHVKMTFVPVGTETQFYLDCARRGHFQEFCFASAQQETAAYSLSQDRRVVLVNAEALISLTMQLVNLFLDGPD